MPSLFVEFEMNKQIAQINFTCGTQEVFEALKEKVTAYAVKVSTLRLDVGRLFLRLSSESVEEIEKAKEFFKNENEAKINCGAMLYVSPRESIKQNGFAVGPKSPIDTVSLWLEVSPNGEGKVEVSYEEIQSDDRSVLDEIMQRLFNASPGITAPVVDCNVNFTGYKEENDPAENIVEDAVVFAFESALAKASPKTMEPVMKVSMSVSEENLPDAIAFINRQRGMIEELDETGELKIVRSSIPLDEIMATKATFLTLTKGGSFEYDFKNFVVRPDNVK